MKCEVMMSKQEEMAVIGGMVTELAEVKRRVAALEERMRQHGKELSRISKELDRLLMFGPAEVDLAALPTSDALEELLSEWREARARQIQLQASLQRLGL
jgi:predicted  nucleic acid-binding Zn-ribbon protein